MSPRRSLRRSSLGFFVSFAVSLFSAPLLRGVDFQPVNPAELKMTSEAQAPGAPAIILYREVDRDDYGRNAHGGYYIVGGETGRFEQNYRRIKILTEEGRKYADIEIPMLAGYHDISGIHARTIRPDGSIVNFTGTVFEKTISKSKGQKYQAKTFTLPDVQVGSIIEYYYSVNFASGWIWSSLWIVDDELFERQAKFTLRPFSSESFRVSLRWTQHLPAGMPEPQEASDGMIRLEVHDVPAFQSEDFMPPENELRARVNFTYSVDAFDPDVSKFWRKVGKKRNDEVESFAGKRNAMEQAAGQMVSPSDPPEIKLQKLYARVQQLRNTTYEVEKTEEQKKRENENEKDVANAEEVLKRGYGSENQLNWLYLALVRAAGIDASGVSVSDRSEDFFSPQRMNSHELDRSAVLVKINGKDTYLAPGAAFTPFGLLPWQETGVSALRLDKDGGAWVQTAVPDSSLSRVERKADLKLSETGDLEGKLTISFTGLEGSRRRIEERNEDDVARKKYLEGELKEYVPAASEVHLSNTPDWASSSTPLVAEFNIKIPGWVTRGGKLAFLPVGVFAASEKHLFDHAGRIHPIYFKFPSQQADDLKVELPAGWSVSGLPQVQNQDFRVVAYSVGADNEKGVVRMSRKLNINIVSMDAKYYSPLRSFFQGVRAGDDEKVVLAAGTTVSSN